MGQDDERSRYVLYLTAKRSVDDRALNRQVMDALRDALRAAGPADCPLRVLELGAGNATMVARLVEWGLLARADYVAVDADAAAVADGAAAVPRWTGGLGLAAAEEPGGQGDHLWRVRGAGVDLSVRLVHRDLFAFDGRPSPFDLLIANAFLDLVDVPSVLPRLWSWLRPDGLFWFTINYDGETILEPALSPALEARIFALYHRSMDERVVAGRPSGDSRCGRHLFGHLPASGAEILAAGSSDSVVFPAGGRYPGDEALFLHAILDTIEAELRGHAELDAGELAVWIAERRRQVDRAGLTYVAHQLDFFGRAPRGRS